MRILVASHSGELIGAERSLLEHVRKIKEKGHEVYVTVPRTGPLVEALKADSIRTIKIPTPLWISSKSHGLLGVVRIVLNLFAVLPWLGLLLRLGPSIVITNSIVIPAPALACKILRTRHAWFVRESILTNPALNSVLGRRKVLRYVDITSHAIFVVSDFVRAQVESVVAERSKVFVVWPPIRVQLGRQASADHDDSDRSSPFTALFASSITEDKGIGEALEAVAYAQMVGVDVLLKIAGKPTRGAMKQVIRDAERLGISSRLQWLGWVDNMDYVYSCSSVFLMTSQNEAFGRVTIEALAYGLPVLAIDSGASSELLSHGGGVLADASSLGQCLVELVKQDDYRSRLANEARTAASTFLDTDSRLDVFTDQLPTRLGVV